MPDDAPPPPVLAARDSDVGGMLVRRALPTRGRRLIGAWCFLDQAGPVEIAGGPGMRVGPHPHIGLQTFTWMIEGELLHRDSLGHAQRIAPGQVNLMTAGRGIAHSEESPGAHGPRVLLAQLWIALPDRVRHCAPSFEHHADIPVVAHQGLVASVLVGSALGARSPVRVHSPLVGLDLLTPAAARAHLPLEVGFEHGVVVLEGEATVAGQALAPGQLMYVPPGHGALTLETHGRARALLIGGAPFEEPVLMFWNYVARTPDEIAEAAAQWNAGDPRFGEVRGFDGPRLDSPLPPPGLRASSG